LHQWQAFLLLLVSFEFLMVSCCAFLLFLSNMLLLAVLLLLAFLLLRAFLLLLVSLLILVSIFLPGGFTYWIVK
jgi:hypothetical protein